MKVAVWRVSRVGISYSVFSLHRNMEEAPKPQENGVTSDPGSQTAVLPPKPPPQGTMEGSLGTQLSTSSSDSQTSNASFSQDNALRSSPPNIPQPNQPSKLEVMMGNVVDVSNETQRPTRDDSSQDSQNPSR